MTAVRKTYAHIDIAKFILAFFVVAIHVRPFDNIEIDRRRALLFGSCSCRALFFHRVRISLLSETKKTPGKQGDSERASKQKPYSNFILYGRSSICPSSHSAACKMTFRFRGCYPIRARHHLRR